MLIYSGSLFECLLELRALVLDVFMSFGAAFVSELLALFDFMEIVYYSLYASLYLLEVL